MFEALAAEVRNLAIPLERDALRELFAIRDLLSVRLERALGEYGDAGLHEVDGSVTLAAWVRHETGADSATAVRTVRRARLLHDSDELAAAAVDGRVSYGQVEAIAVAVGRHRGLFAEHAPELLDTLEPLDTHTTGLAMTAWRQAADDVDPRPDRERDDELRLVRTLGGRGDLHGSFGPDLLAVVDAAVRTALDRDDERTLAQRQADALGVVCRHFLDHQTDRPGGRHRPHLNVVLRDDDLEYVGGAADGLPVGIAERGVLRCDSVVHRLLFSAASGILDYGRGTRSVPVDLYNAIVLRDRGCRFPGCDRPASWCDAHHVRAWEHGGPTSIDNLVLLCRRHHRKLHAGWHAKLLPDATLEVTHPDGRTEASVARGPIDPRRRRPPPRRQPVAA